jgi:hypothetical protein
VGREAAREIGPGLGAHPDVGDAGSRVQEAVELKEEAEAALRLGLTRAPTSQLLNLTLLAPAVQGKVLPPVEVAEVESIGGRAFCVVVRLCRGCDQRSSLIAQGSGRPMSAPT